MRLLVLVAVLFATPVPGQIYEWVDENGKRNYSDQKPEGVEYRIIDAAGSTLTGHQRSRYSVTRKRTPPPPATDQRPDHQPIPDGAAEADLKWLPCPIYRAELERMERQLRTGSRKDQEQELRDQHIKILTLYKENCRH